MGRRSNCIFKEEEVIRRTKKEREIVKIKKKTEGKGRVLKKTRREKKTGLRTQSS
jgi:hypothetical protein